MRRIKALILAAVAALCCASSWAGNNDLLWDYSTTAPKQSPDNGLYYESSVNDAAGTNLGLKGIKLNSSGWAYFEKAAVAGTLKLTISNRKNTSDYKVNVSHGTKAEGEKPVKGELIAVTEVANGPTVVSVPLTADVKGIYIDRNTSSEGVLSKVEFTETVARSFIDFKIDFRTDPYTVVTPESGLPQGVSADGSFHDNQHGYSNAIVTVPVDGPVKFTIATCQHSDHATVSIDNGTPITIDTKGSCDNGFGTYTHFTTYTYKGGQATLKLNLGKYCPFLFAEAVEVKPATLTFMDQNGNKLAEIEKEEGDPLGEVPAEVTAKIQVPENQKMRGWKYATGIKALPTDLLQGNTTLIASVTNIEKPATGTHYKFSLNHASDYMTDHDLIWATGGASYHDGTHGWVFGAGDKLMLVVSPKSYVSVGLCQYSGTGGQTITNRHGATVATMTADSERDGTLCSFYNENDGIDTLSFNFTTTSYIHYVEVYNVSAPLFKLGQTYDITAGDAGSFLMACAQLQDGDTIRLHNGIYDLGETVLTAISANHVVVIGESMDNTIIRNAPDAKQESINNTATLYNTGNDNVFENLTLQNALDYYKSNNGRAVCLQDKGTRTACYKVKMLSYQDTYYSNLPGQQCYFEDCEIHGTVDFICGSGSVYFYNCLLYCEKRNSEGGGQDCITASNSQTSHGDKGYVFDRCTIKSECPVVSLGRAWNDQPQVAYLLTTLDMSAGHFTLTDGSKILRWTLAGMNVCAYDFAEFYTMDSNGTMVSPLSNKLNFSHSTGNREIETIIGYEAAEAKSYTHFFSDWNPAHNYVDFYNPTDMKLVHTCECGIEGKQIRNGQLVIAKNGQIFNTAGLPRK